MRYALVGCGRIAPNHISAALSCGLEFAAFCDLDLAKAEAARKRAGLDESVPCYRDHKKMLDEVCPELVAVATYSGAHASIALDCINAGCNVIIEKPIALSLSDADAIIKAAEYKGVTVAACHQNRFNPAVDVTRRALEAGRFGKLYNGAVCIRWLRTPEYFAEADWRGTYELDGGTLMNQCIHGIDLLRWMLGDEIDEVTAYTDNLSHPYIEAEDIGVAIVKFKNGSYGTIEGSSNVFPRDLEETLALFGSNGSVKLGGRAVNTVDDWLFSDAIDDEDEIKTKFSETHKSIYGRGHSLLYADVIDAIVKKRPPYVTAEDGRRALELVLAMYKSSAENKSIRLPLKNCSTLDFCQ